METDTELKDEQIAALKNENLLLRRKIEDLEENLATLETRLDFDSEWRMI